LTTYLSRFAQLSSSVQSKLIDLKLKNLLIRSRFVFDSNTALSLLESKLVYVNGHLVTNPSLLLFMGDVIQIIVQFKFYVVYR
jgi:ribosomal protein S4